MSGLQRIAEVNSVLWIVGLVGPRILTLRNITAAAAQNTVIVAATPYWRKIRVNGRQENSTVIECSPWKPSASLMTYRTLRMILRVGLSCSRPLPPSGALAASSSSSYAGQVVDFERRQGQSTANPGRYAITKSDDG